ncbi:MAG: MmgE/PrpD family protein [Sedimentitalea sp.]
MSSPNAQPPNTLPTRAGNGDQTQRSSLSEQLVQICNRHPAGADRSAAATLLLDWIGVAGAGANTPQGRAVRNTVKPHDGGALCTALALGRVNAEQAAYVNGSYGTLLEMDDLHRASILHAGDVVIPAALAAAQEAGCRGTDLLDAIIMGYEVALRIGVAAAQGGYSAWYNSGTCGVFGAAMAAAQAFGLTEQQKCDALGHAGMQAAGLWQCRLEPSDSKCLATAHAARAGVSAARAAACGLRAPREILEGALGFFATLYPNARTDGICADLPGWRLHEVSFKPWPACRHVHPAIGVALQLRADLDVSAIARIKVRSYAAGVDFCDQPCPQTPHQARFSFQHAVAIALLKGPPGLADFTTEALEIKTLKQVRDKIDVLEDPALTAAFPNHMGAGLDITLHDGPVMAHTAAHAPGDPDMPVTREALHAKFRTNLRAAGADPDHADRIIRSVAALTEAPSLNTLNHDLDLMTRHTQSELQRMPDP